MSEGKKEILLGDCLELMKDIPNGSIDAIICDLPYGTTQNKWDSILPLDKLWEQYKRILKPNGIVCLFGDLGFKAKLILSNEQMFKYDLIWDKVVPSGFLNANKMPMRRHEHILVFYKELPIFNPQKTKGNPNHISNGKISSKGKNNNYGNFEQLARFRTEDKFPKSVIYFEQNDPNVIIHPTQKSLDLFRWLVLSYSNENDLVFDGYMGSGTTAMACIEENRRFLGSELHKEYYDKATKRIEIEQSQPSLFAGR